MGGAESLCSSPGPSTLAQLAIASVNATSSCPSNPSGASQATRVEEEVNADDNILSPRASTQASLAPLSWVSFPGSDVRPNSRSPTKRKVSTKEKSEGEGEEEAELTQRMRRRVDVDPGPAELSDKARSGLKWFFRVDGVVIVVVL